MPVKRAQYESERGIRFRIKKYGRSAVSKNSRKGTYLEYFKPGQKVKHTMKLDEAKLNQLGGLETYKRLAVGKLRGKRTTYDVVWKRARRDIRKSTERTIREGMRVQGLPTVDDSFKQGLSKITTTFGDMRNDPNALYERLLRPIIKHEGLKQVLIQDPERWKKFLMYEITWTGENEEGNKMALGQLHDVKKTFSELLNDFDNYEEGDYIVQQNETHGRSDTNIENDIRFGRIIVNTGQNVNNANAGVIQRVIVDVILAKTEGKGSMK